MLYNYIYKDFQAEPLGIVIVETPKQHERLQGFSSEMMSFLKFSFTNIPSFPSFGLNSYFLHALFSYGSENWENIKQRTEKNRKTYDAKVMLHKPCFYIGRYGSFIKLRQNRLHVKKRFYAPLLEGKIRFLKFSA